MLVGRWYLGARLQASELSSFNKHIEIREFLNFFSSVSQSIWQRASLIFQSSEVPEPMCSLFELWAKTDQCMKQKIASLLILPKSSRTHCSTDTPDIWKETCYYGQFCSKTSLNRPPWNNPLTSGQLGDQR